MAEPRRSAFPKRARHLAVGLLLLAPCAAAQTRPEPNPDVQFWPELVVSHQFTEHASAAVAGSYRFSHDVTHASDRYLAGRLTYAPFRFLSFTPDFRYNRSETAHNTLSHEKRLTFDVALRAPQLRGWDFSDRHRGEWRLLDGHWSERYRNRAQVERSFSFDGHRLTPYGAFEESYDTRYGWNRAREYAGIRLPLAHRLTLDAAYLHQQDGHAVFQHLHVLSTSLRLEL